MIFAHRDYRLILKDALTAKSGGREPQSIRAFAKKLGVSTSFLSEVLNSHKALSMEYAFKVAIRLGLTDLEAQYFCLLVQLEHEKDPFFREEIQRRLNEVSPKRQARDISVDLFRSISEWYHAAILELTYLPGFLLSAENAAKKLGITKAEAEAAISRLERLDLLVKTRGAWRKADNYVHSEAHIPSQAFREFHGRVLAKAGEALQWQSPKERMSATDVLAFDSKQLPTVDRLSREFSSAVMKLSEKSKVKDSVYALAVQFFRLSDFKGIS